jgi:hypothetical protein
VLTASDEEFIKKNKDKEMKEGTYKAVKAGKIHDTGIFYTSKPENAKPEKVENEYDFVNPSHYQNFSVEVIDMMARIWGKEATALHCEMCAFKYKMRAGDKPEQPIERDLDKSKWYINKAKELRNE